MRRRSAEHAGVGVQRAVAWVWLDGEAGRAMVVVAAGGGRVPGYVALGGDAGDASRLELRAEDGIGESSLVGFADKPNQQPWVDLAVGAKRRRASRRWVAPRAGELVKVRAEPVDDRPRAGRRLPLGHE